jgi:hypothetical protein
VNLRRKKEEKIVHFDHLPGLRSVASVKSARFALATFEERFEQRKSRDAFRVFFKRDP